MNFQILGRKFLLLACGLWAFISDVLQNKNAAHTCVFTYIICARTTILFWNIRLRIHLMPLIDNFNTFILNSATVKQGCALCNIKHQYEKETSTLWFLSSNFSRPLHCIGRLDKTWQSGFLHQMILKSVLSSRDHLGLWDPERHEEPEEEVHHWIYIETQKKKNCRRL